MQQPSTQPVSNENRLLAALGYPFGIIALIILLTEMKNNRFMKYHAIQALLFVLAAFIIFVGASILLAILGAISEAFLFLAFLYPLLAIGWFVATIFYAAQAYQGKIFAIPVVGPYAARYSGTT